MIVILASLAGFLFPALILAIHYSIKKKRGAG